MDANKLFIVQIDSNPNQHDEASGRFKMVFMEAEDETDAIIKTYARFNTNPQHCRITAKPFLNTLIEISSWSIG